MTQNRKDLMEWRNERNLISSNYMNFVANVIEELLEPIVKDSKKLKYVQAQMMSLVPDTDMMSTNDIVDCITDIRVFAENETELMGYDSDKTLAEVIKEISSRIQDPKQAEDWEINGNPNGDKWQKWKEQPKDTLYKANFNLAKI